MFNIVLFEPEIPANTGNIIRLCANTGAQLHLIHPLGFDLDDKKLRRAGLDYHEWVNLHQHASLDDFINKIKPTRLFALTTKGTKNYVDVSYHTGDALLFGPETRGLPNSFLRQHDPDLKVYIPMKPESRSLNLSNTVSIVLFEAWKQLGFSGASFKI
ncbi:MAG: tRNA (uridine(34)/cytosine(34)/5-carboxymethylaminomethyluridine(34)-2'-O)-methyltransferase TrmL [Methylococcales bacterium]|nr:tRNA (uridine(34)/cytosine(34)/5-carboxymethylaminomethyluridine(34)-2'-O)-methyltransferase TrmL [Methylococcales bacterium]